MNGMPMAYCLRCAAVRAVTDCQDRGDEMIIQLEPCNHVILRTDGLEWFVDKADVAPGLSGASHLVGSGPR